MNVEIVQATPNPEETICIAARNDYSEDGPIGRSFEDIMSGIDGDSLDEKKETLIGHLLDRGHFGPFEHPQITIAIEGVSRVLMAQLTRHRPVTFDIQSMRYVDFVAMEPGDAVVVPQSANDVNAGNRDPDAKPLDDIYDDAFEDEPPSDYTKAQWIERERRLTYEQAIDDAFESYGRLRELGMPPEDARFVLPLGAKVNIVMSLNARMLMHVADMRAAADAQWEIRDMTNEVLSLAEEWCPITFEHYNEHLKHRKNRLSP